MRRNIMNLDTTTPQTFSAFFNRTGYRVDRDADDIERFEPTLLVTNVKDGNGRMITDHLWFNYSADFQALGQLKSGELLKFTATPQTYMKGRPGEHHKDFQLTDPTDIALVRKADHKPVPDTKDALIGWIMKTNEKFYRISGRMIDPDMLAAYEEWLAGQE
ncbi:hypothetical protein [Lacticaseibacillus sharpeae]|uniref:Uncharacterized protein n=1 Tax=Lacticaseibacillus sharpeae JCM 1186 = DSM 20505 TaxID=1291052 RepID=A0A0R1ZHL6_9LACO|nr:hypothetical protein [Lacticaseibacillus sharpeae]KRM54401.1 hypothetical protein FC18_GL000623 [Lacticaseibacillus sharpeae JCM 1186 = DSM 20505]